MKVEYYKSEYFNVHESIKNQNILWTKGLPKFAPDRGWCWSCGKNIYLPRFWIHNNFKNIETSIDNASYVSGITIEESKKLITGCPHCHKSYCD